MKHVVNKILSSANKTNSNWTSLLTLNEDWKKIIDFSFPRVDGAPEIAREIFKSQWVDFLKQFVQLMRTMPNADANVQEKMRELGMQKVKQLLTHINIDKKSKHPAEETIINFLIYVTRFIQASASITEPTEEEKQLISHCEELAKNKNAEYFLSSIEKELFTTLLLDKKERNQIGRLFQERYLSLAPNSHSGKDTHWYDSDEINQSLSQLEQNPHVKVYPPMLGTDLDNYNFLKAQLEELNDNRVIPAHADAERRQVIIPLNLGTEKGEGIHWVLLYLRYPSLPEAMPQIIYIDSKGEKMLPSMKKHLNELFPHVEIDENKVVLQKDGYNCGPWIIAVAPLLIRYEPFLASNMLTVTGLLSGLKGQDIYPERERQLDCLSQLTPYVSPFLINPMSLPQASNPEKKARLFDVSKFKAYKELVKQATRSLQPTTIQQAPSPEQADKNWPHILDICLTANEVFKPVFLAEGNFSAAFFEFSGEIDRLSQSPSDNLESELRQVLKEALNHANEEGPLIFKQHLANFLFIDSFTRATVFDNSATREMQPNSTADEYNTILLQHLQMAFKGEPVKGSEPQNTLSFA
jgi:hypothetical protein